MNPTPEEMEEAGFDSGLEESAAVDVSQPLNLTDRLLAEVKAERQTQDAELGMLRDYRDGTNGTRFHGPAAQTDKQSLLEARRALSEATRHGRQSWRHFLELATAELYAESDEKKMKRFLVNIAATACSWREGLEVRNDDRRIAAEQKAMVLNKKGKLVRFRNSWWQKLLAVLLFWR